MCTVVVATSQVLCESPLLKEMMPILINCMVEQFCQIKNHSEPDISRRRLDQKIGAEISILTL